MTTRTGVAYCWTISVVAAVLGWAPRVRAQEPTVIWYRSSSDCPSAAEFQARVEERGRSAKIATAGDRVDFVVTLSQGKDGAIGRLERQTDDGIVAIRELTGDTCAEVADAVAFTLDLASRDRTAEPNETPTPPAAETVEPERVSSTRESTPPVVASGRVEPSDPQVASGGASPSRPVLGGPWWGISAVGRSAVAPHGLWGGAFAVSFERGWLPWRLEGHLASGSHDGARGRFHVTLWSGRVEACPLRVESSVRLSWCGGLELGVLGARGDEPDGRKPSSLWLAGLAEERLRWPANRPFAVEASLGMFAPFRAYRVVAQNPAAELHRVDALGLMASLGVVLQLD